MRKAKEPSESENQARAPRKDPEARQTRAGEDECCALLRAYPIAAPPQPRRRRTHENGGDKRP